MLARAHPWFGFELEMPDRAWLDFQHRYAEVSTTVDDPSRHTPPGGGDPQDGRPERLRARRLARPDGPGRLPHPPICTRCRIGCLDPRPRRGGLRHGLPLPGLPGLKALSLPDLIREFLAVSVPVPGEMWKWERLAKEIERRVGTEYGKRPKR
jgi:hypothetical protein